MSNFIFKQIPKSDEQKLRAHIDKVIKSLKNPAEFIPYEEWEYQQMFDENYAPLFGAYDGDKLVGMSQLYISGAFMDEYAKVFGLEGHKICEYGGELVLPEYQGKGIMTELLNIMYRKAKELNMEYVISMAHPDNKASNHLLEKAGLKFVRETTVSGGFPRNLYIMKL